MSGAAFAALPSLITATSAVAISGGHEIDAVDDNVNLVDMDAVEPSGDPSRKRALSYVSDGSDAEVMLKKRRGRPAKSASFHARKPRIRKQKNVEKKPVDVVDDTDIRAMIDVGVQTDVDELNVLSRVASTAVLTDSISKTIKEAIDPVTTELQFTTIDVKELLVTLHQLASQVQLLSAAVASLSVKKPSTTQSQSDSETSESSDSDIVEGIAGDWTEVTHGLKKLRKHNSSASPIDSVVQLKRDPPQARDNTEKSFIASMYVDLELKERRSKNIILSGMPYSRVSDDFTTATNMLAEEFDLHYIPTVSCRRLGRLIEGRRQLLLITMETRQDADYFIANAKYLRNSRDPEVRDHVYISADLTPAESKAAYDLRCRRRQQRVTVGQVGEQTVPAHYRDNRQPAVSNASAIGVRPPLEVVTVDVHASFDGDGRPGKT